MAKMFEEEPEPLDENDPQVKEELFETMNMMGVKPVDVADAEEAKEYAEWLAKSL
jgi:hypothetical protein